jgi:hypothetical protein
LPVFHKGTDQKNGIKELKKEKVDWRENVFGFFTGLEMTFWTVWTLDEKDKTNSALTINFLKQKYVHRAMLTRA